MLSIRYCSTCAGMRSFERLPCSDGHGADCPELICVECGFIVVVAVVDEAPAAELVMRSVA